MSLTDKYNAYLKINGGTIGEASCDRAAKPTDAKCIDEDTPLIALISHKNEEIVDYDWLYIVLMHIVSFLNDSVHVSVHIWALPYTMVGTVTLGLTYSTKYEPNISLLKTDSLLHVWTTGHWV